MNAPQPELENVLDDHSVTAISVADVAVVAVKDANATALDLVVAKRRAAILRMINGVLDDPLIGGEYRVDLNSAPVWLQEFVEAAKSENFIVIAMLREIASNRKLARSMARQVVADTETPRWLRSFLVFCAWFAPQQSCN